MQGVLKDMMKGFLIASAGTSLVLSVLTLAGVVLILLNGGKV